MEYFQLNRCQAIVMFGCQYLLVDADIKRESDYGKQALKEKWLSQWKDGIEKFIAQIYEYRNSTENSSHLDFPFTSLSKLPDDYLGNGDIGYLNKVKIFVEIVLFSPYYQLDEDTDKYKNLKICKSEKWEQDLKTISTCFGLSCIKQIRDNYQKSLNYITGKKFNPFIMVFGALFLMLLAPFAIPAIVAVLAPLIVPGVYGAAAYAAVMAALGGGAIAVGGMGMVGGLVVVVAGGGILGAAAGAGISALLQKSPEIAATQGAKLYVVIQELFAYKTTFAQEIVHNIISQLKESIRSLEDELDELSRKDSSSNSEKIKNLNKSIGYMRKTLELLRASPSWPN